MTERMDKFAEELLQKTLAKKLKWTSGTNLRADVAIESYLTQLGDGDGVTFLISRSQSGENIRVSMMLQMHPQSSPVRVEVRNWPLRHDGSTDEEAVRRFRLYSDLFDAARESTFDVDDEFGKVEELLRKIG
jgi:hypothetical protein